MADTVMIPGGIRIPTNSGYVPSQDIDGAIAAAQAEKAAQASDITDISNSNNIVSYYERGSSDSSSATVAKQIERKPVRVSDNANTDRFVNPSHTSEKGNRSFINTFSGVANPGAAAVKTGEGIHSMITKIDVNKSNLEANSKKIRNAASKLDSIWNDIKVGQIGKINNSWVGSAAETYTSKVLDMEPKINAVKEALSLIARSYDAAISEIDSKQEQLKGKIQGI